VFAARMDRFDDMAAIPGTSNQATPPPRPPTPELRRLYGIQYPDGDFVRRVGDVCGVIPSAMDDRAASQVADAIRCHLKEVIKEASRFSVHGRRLRMIPQDLDDALRLMGVQQPLYGMRTSHGEPFKFAGSAGKELVWRDEGEVELGPIIHALPPRMPLEPQLKPHWLVIDGVQPAVPENPVPPTPLAILPGGLASGGGGAGRDERGGERTEGGAMARTLTTHTLSLEQQVYFKEIVESVVGHDADKRNEALHCLQTDRGLQSMAPRFVLTIVEGVRTNIGCRNLHCLQQLLLMTHALMNNPALNMARVVHDLLPAVLSCCVSRRISARPSVDNHWAVRQAAAKLIARMCNTIETGVLRTRVSHLYMKAFGGRGARPNGRRPALATLYGAVFGLSELGAEAVRTLIVPRAEWLHEECTRAMKKEEEEEGGTKEKKAALEDESSQEENGADMQNDEKKAARKMIELVTSILISYVCKTLVPASISDLSEYTKQLGGFGDAVFKATASECTSRPTGPPPPAPPPASLPRPMQHRLPVSTTPRPRPPPPSGYAYGAAPPGYRSMGGPRPPGGSQYPPGGSQYQHRYM
ncbi:hypothetical protein PMAYCL1PPCAC_01452, partial [Pristionchus mayeri]